MHMAEIRIENLSKRYGEVAAVDNISLHVRDGEFFTLLGPSGCGKSTLLSMLAGLTPPDGGKLVVGDKVFSDAATKTFVLPEQRDCGLVFQSYALWPHMTVEENTKYGLKLRKVPKDEQKVRVREVLELVGLENYANRYPHELSGGQQQRVALARTIVARPKVLLLDEPLSNLDAKLRMQARSWLKEIHSETRLTTVYVTHDQEEALSLSDRIAVLDGGVLQQVADPFSLYDKPSTPTVAAFIGSTSFLLGTVVRTRPKALTIALSPSSDRDKGVEVEVESDVHFKAGTRVQIALRPEQLELVDLNHSSSSSTGLTVPCVLVSRSYLGGRFLYDLMISGCKAQAVLTEPLEAEEYGVRFLTPHMPVFEADSIGES